MATLDAGKGAGDFAALARRLKAAGEKDLRKELYSGITRATKPMRADIKQHSTGYMPSGYGATFQKSLRLTAIKRASAKNPAVQIKAVGKGKTRPRQVGPINGGTLRHPLFGNREFWYTTRIKPGFFTKEAKKGAPQAAKEILKAMNDVAEKVAKK